MYCDLCCRFQIYAFRHQAMLFFIAGLALLLIGLQNISFAQAYGGSPGDPTMDYRFVAITQRALGLIEGSLGGLVMVIAGLLAIINAAMGAYKAAIALLVVAVGSFVLRSLVSMFFRVDPSILPSPDMDM